MRHPPIPRPNVYELYWRFASARQGAFEARVAGSPAPWTTDRIIQTYKFCNVYRAADRVSQYMIRDVCYHEEDCTDEDRLFQIMAFRTFSKIETWRGVRRLLGRFPTLEDLGNDSLTKALEAIKLQNGGLYTAAFILCANDAYGCSLKHLNHIELFRHMFIRDSLGSQILEVRSLRELYDLLHRYPLMGDFMSYQIAVDLNYSPLVCFSENDFTQPGPGAIRGLKKCFQSLEDYSPAEAILWMVERQQEEFARLALPFNGLWGRPLHAIDCQGLFCETDKYCREAVPDLASNRKHIKAKFSPAAESVTLMFPPKWGINGLLPKGEVLGLESTNGTLF